MYQNFIIPYLHEAQHVSDGTPPVIRRLKLHWQSLVFQAQPDNVHQIRVQTTFRVWKTRSCQCSFRLLIIGGMSPETCWASCKYGIIKFWYIVASCWVFLINCTMMHGSTDIKYSSFCWNIYWQRLIYGVRFVHISPHHQHHHYHRHHHHHHH